MWSSRIFRKNIKSWYTTNYWNSNKFKISNIIGKITLYATTETGYKNLTKLSSKSYLKSDDNEDPACDIEKILFKIIKIDIINRKLFKLFLENFFHKNKLKEV